MPSDDDLPDSLAGSSASDGAVVPTITVLAIIGVVLVSVVLLLRTVRSLFNGRIAKGVPCLRRETQTVLSPAVVGVAIIDDEQSCVSDAVVVAPEARATASETFIAAEHTADSEPRTPERIETHELHADFTPDDDRQRHTRERVQRARLNRLRSQMAHEVHEEGPCEHLPLSYETIEATEPPIPLDDAGRPTVVQVTTASPVEDSFVPPYAVRAHGETLVTGSHNYYKRRYNEFLSIFSSAAREHRYPPPDKPPSDDLQGALPSRRPPPPSSPRRRGAARRMHYARACMHVNACIVM